MEPQIMVDDLNIKINYMRSILVLKMICSLLGINYACVSGNRSVFDITLAHPYVFLIG